MRTSILFLSLFLSTNLFADELHHFDEIKSSVTVGKPIHIVIDFQKCSSHLQTSERMNIGVFTPNAIQVLNNHIATSLTHFTLNNPNFLGKPVYEFITYAITANDTVILTHQVLDATSYTPLSNKVSLNCKIDAGAKIYN